MNKNKAFCPVESTMKIIGGKWKPIIIYQLLSGTKRFSELKRILTGITQQMLTLQLRELESDRIVKRTVYAQVPPKVEYSLTKSGKSLEKILRQMELWGKSHQLASR